MRPRFLFLSQRGGGDLRQRLDARLAALLPLRTLIGNDWLFSAPDAPVIELPAIEGVLVGSLFSADGSSARGNLSGTEQLAIMSSDGSSLVRSASGAFVALWRGCGPAPLKALRDPSAVLPAYCVMDDQIVAIASDVECLEMAGLTRLAIDLSGVATFLRFPLVPTDRTCIIGVRELLPGYLATFADGLSHIRPIWRPRDFGEILDARPTEIAVAIDQAVSGQCATADRVAVELSGGLDSSIVAAAMPGSVDRTAIHMVTAAQDGDERRYAQLVIDRLGLNRHEVSLGFSDIEIVAPPRRLTAKPTGVDHLSTLDRRLRGALMEVGADFALSGAGGDSVFCYLTSTAPILDAWQDGGWSLSRSTISAIARISNVSEWDVLRHLSNRMLRRGKRKWSWPANDLLLGSAARRVTAPDASQLDGLRRGKRAHVASILRSQGLFDSYERMAEGTMRYPLFSQPVVEACLRVPSWRWMEGGINRAVAREAFAGRLPEAIVWRTGKGRLDTLLIRAYDAARPAIRSLLMDGWLASHGMIDVDAVSAALAEPVTGASTTHSRIQSFADAELWCRMILDRQSKPGTC
jgi:asparagine synthase (glutamine-hydrolysing)